MMKRILVTPALVVLVSLPTLAAAEDYGTPGQLEAGGTFGILSETETVKPEDGDEIETTRTQLIVNPTVGYYVTDGLEFLGGLGVISATEKVDDADPTTVMLLSLGVGAGYFAKVGANLRVGPQLLLRYESLTLEAEDPALGGISANQTGTGAELGAFAKMAIGGGGVLAAGFAVDFRNVSQSVELEDLDVEADFEGTVTNMGARIGYFVFF